MARRQRINTTRLLDRDYEILEHLMTYRVTTREVLHRQFFADSELNAVSKVTTRLTENGYLARHEFLANSVYFTLGLRGAKLFGAPARCARNPEPRLCTRSWEFWDTVLAKSLSGRVCEWPHSGKNIRRF
jgi:hypothetical protein